ncbi:YgfZ/GcvT domain-containing protein [Pseudoxanthomonas sacheonensis]|uniref:Folate-binding protein YgfZ n=1 Tax=Pseudoxanthomonas sacheonensis TaxID=443615 RepID=A0ABU1RNZ5_9GAMM|nr:folate-binding protein [Pseudoxanthomonas sacheonensis]MDR6840498.1 folate-binding protein YgfZ [Pseudoxanthomonas sacheonensis]
MPDNLPVSAAPFFALPDHAVVALDGPDATAFAQAQFANDVVALSPGHWQWNAWLTPKGRVIAVFALLKLAEDRILLLVPDTDAGELGTQLQRFVFRRKLKISAPAGLKVGGALREPDSAQSARIGFQGSSIELDYGDDHQARSLLIAPMEDLPYDSESHARWTTHDLHAGLPRLPTGQREQWTPQQLSLERLQAFSVKKGCYPGQEIVARTHFLGKAKRGLVLFEGDAPLPVGAEVSDGERTIGTLVSVADGQTPLALAVLPLDRPSAPLQAGDIALREIPLRDGLQR